MRRVCGQNASMPSARSISRFIDTMAFQKTSKLEFLSFLEYYAKFYPDKTFGEIFELPEVLSAHLEKAHAYYSESYEKNRLIFELMERNLKLTPEQKEKLAGLHKKAVNISIGNISDNLKKYLIWQNYASFQSEVGGARALQLAEYAKKIPLSPGSPDLILAHMAGKSDAHIMQGMLAPVTPMKKRISPDDGHCIVVCQNCATTAGKVPFAMLFSIFPKMYESLQEQLNTIISYLANGHLRGNGDYPKAIQTLVLKATQGQKVLNLDKYFHLRRKIHQISSRPLSPSEVASKTAGKLKDLRILY